MATLGGNGGFCSLQNTVYTQDFSALLSQCWKMTASYQYKIDTQMKMAPIEKLSLDLPPPQLLSPFLIFIPLLLSSLRSDEPAQPGTPAGVFGRHPDQPAAAEGQDGAALAGRPGR